MIEIPPSLSIVAPNTAEELVMVVTVGFDKVGAVTDVVVALVVCAPAVK